MSLHIGDAVVLPFDENATNLDVQRLCAVVVAVSKTTVATIDGHGDRVVSPISEIHLVASYRDILQQLTQKGVELIGKVTDR